MRWTLIQSEKGRHNNYVPQKLPKLVHLFDTHQGGPGSSLGAMEHQLVERMLDEAEEEFKIGIILVYMRIVELDGFSFR